MEERKPTHSFGIETPGGMLAKVERELDRLAKETFKPEAVVDHCINCAWTCFHLIDWVWQLHFRQNSDAQMDLAAKAQIPETQIGDNGAYVPRWMKEAMFSFCAELKLCEGLANGSKHVFPEITPTEIVEAFVSARTPQEFVLGYSTLGGGDVLGPVDSSMTQYLPKISDEDGNTHDAIQVFDAAVLFWRKFIAEFGIE